MIAVDIGRLALVAAISLCICKSRVLGATQKKITESDLSQFSESWANLSQMKHDARANLKSLQRTNCSTFTGNSQIICNNFAKLNPANGNSLREPILRNAVNTLKVQKIIDEAFSPEWTGDVSKRHSFATIQFITHVEQTLDDYKQLVAQSNRQQSCVRRKYLKLLTAFVAPRCAQDSNLMNPLEHRDDERSMECLIQAIRSRTLKGGGKKTDAKIMVVMRQLGWLRSLKFKNTFKMMALNCSCIGSDALIAAARLHQSIAQQDRLFEGYSKDILRLIQAAFVCVELFQELGSKKDMDNMMEMV